MKEKNKNNNIDENVDKKKKRFSIILFIRVISVVLIIVCIALIIYRHFNLQQSDKVIDNINSNINITDKNVEVSGSTATLIDTDILSLKNKNSDTVAWLKVNGTNVNYPVVHTTDNNYYLKHSFDKSSSQSGWIFMDYRNSSNLSDDNTVIYGHNMLNNTMFSSLTNVLNESFFSTEENKYINLTTENSSTIWKIFSVYTINPEIYYTTVNFNSKIDFSNFLNTITSRSIYRLGENVTTTDKILTLSTCTNLNLKRLVIHAKLVYTENKK